MNNKKAESDSSIILTIIVIIFLFFAWKWYSQAYFEQQVVNKFSDNMEILDVRNKVSLGCMKSCSGVAPYGAQVECKIQCNSKCNNSPSCAESFGGSGLPKDPECTGQIGVVRMDCKKIKYDSNKLPYCCMD